MSTNLNDETLSQLADGELPAPVLVRTLLAVLDDDAARLRLRDQLRLRELLSAWRERPLPPGLAGVSIATPLSVRGADRAERRRADELWRVATGLIAACVLGGVLVLSGVIAARWGGGSSRPDGSLLVADHAGAEIIGPERRRQLAEVFAFHESAAGPLMWYAADEEAIRLAAAQTERPDSRPVALVLRLTSDDDAQMSRDYAIVCRDGVPATISLPQSDPRLPPLRLFVSPVVRNDGIALRYSLTAEASDEPGPMAAVAGERQIDTELRRLGQIALGDRVLDVEGGAWLLEEVAVQ